MLHISAETPAHAWRAALRALYATQPASHPKYGRDDTASIEVLHPTISEIEPLFPMAQVDIERINKYMISGEHESEVIHPWTRIYRHRLFDGRPSQFDLLISQLRGGTGRGIATVWRSEDATSEIAPCVLTISGRVRNAQLQMIVHARATDAYGKLLMNLYEFMAVQSLAARQLELSVGRFVYFADSCHIYESDVSRVAQLIGGDVAQSATSGG